MCVLIDSRIMTQSSLNSQKYYHPQHTVCTLFQIISIDYMLHMNMKRTYTVLSYIVLNTHRTEYKDHTYKQEANNKHNAQQGILNRLCTVSNSMHDVAIVLRQLNKLVCCV
jgi:hypothetical protein